MGVLGDDDIEKLNQSFKNKKIPKRFYDPVKAYNAYDIAVTVACGAIFLAAFFFMFGDYIINSLEDRVDLVTQQRDQAIEQSGILRTLIVDNADCPSLAVMYHDAKGNPDLDYTKELIKDEIAFRCK